MIDLHLHSTHSDGTLTPAELVACAKKIRLSAISITDHDTVSATPEALAAGRGLGVEVISGLEISSEHEGVSIHLLGYDLEWQHPDLTAVLGRLQDARTERNRKILENFKGIGITLTYEELQETAGTGVIGRPHFARLLVNKGIVKNSDQAFGLYLKTGRPAYAPRFLLNLHEAIDIIHRAGGLVVLAHPIQLGYSAVDLAVFIGHLKKIGLDGIETYYPTQKGKFFKFLKKLATEHDLLQTGGSDYHGNIRPGTSMAGASRSLRVPRSLLGELRRRQMKK